MPSPAVEGPYFDELAIGQEFGGAPGITLTPGLAKAGRCPAATSSPARPGWLG